MKKAVSTELTKANIDRVVALLGETAGNLERLSQSLTDEQLQRPLGPGERSFAEIVAHLIYCEDRSAEAITLALLANEPLLVDIHPERQLGKLLRYDQFALADLVSYFKLRRTFLLAVLNSLTDGQWARVIREEGKARKESVYWRARGMAMHEVEHLADLEGKLNGSRL
jgi:hypothetical protein